MCDCRKEIEKKLLERFKQQKPDAKNHAVILNGYSYVVRDGFHEKGYMDILTNADYPLKKGGFRNKNETQKMFFSFCPFCGQKY
jgi:hypothetical protein